MGGAANSIYVRYSCGKCNAAGCQADHRKFWELPKPLINKVERGLKVSVDNMTGGGCDEAPYAPGKELPPKYPRVWGIQVGRVKGKLSVYGVLNNDVQEDDTATTALLADLAG